MGDYTGIRFQATLNEKGRKVASLVTNLHVPMAWDLVAYALSEDIDLDAWVRQSRSHFIPFGSVDHMFSGWKSRNKFGRIKGTWTWDVSCAVKDDGVVRHFLDRLLPLLISAPVVVEVNFEGDSKKLSVNPLDYKEQPQMLIGDPN